MYLRDPREVQELEQACLVGDLENCAGKLLRSSARTAYSLRRKPKQLAACVDDVSDPNVAGVIVFFADLERVRRVRRVVQNELLRALARGATILLGRGTGEYFNPRAVISRMQRANVGQAGEVAHVERDSRLLKDLLDPSPDVAR